MQPTLQGDSFSEPSKFLDSQAFQPMGWTKTQICEPEQGVFPVRQETFFSISHKRKSTEPLHLPRKQVKLSFDASEDEYSTNDNSPHMKAARGSLVSNFRLDSCNSDLTQSVADFLSEFHAFLDTEQVETPKQTLTCRCFLNHSFKLSYEELKEGRWCRKCELSLQKLKTYLDGKHARLFNKQYSPALIIKCEFDHVFMLSFKNWTKKWCSACTSNQKNYLKQYFLQEEIRIQEENQRIQEQLFEQARTNFSMNLQHSPNKRYESELEHVRKQAKCRAQSDSQESLEMMYFVNLLSEKALESHLRESVDPRNEYKKLCLALHPDKNKHPLSLETFKKLTHVYQSL